MKNKTRFEESQYKGNDVVKIVLGKKYNSDEEEVFMMGLKKVGAVLDHVDELRAWYDRRDPNKRKDHQK